MKLLFLFVTFLLSFTAYADECLEKPLPIEFIESEYVFFGRIMEKSYAPDSSSYTITFQVEKHFKASANRPKTVQFTKPLDSSSVFGKIPAIQQGYNVGTSGLIFAYKTDNGLAFSTECSHSKSYNSISEIDSVTYSFLERGNNISLDQIVFTRYYAGILNENFALPQTQQALKTILQSIKATGSENLAHGQVENFALLINAKGKLKRIVALKNSTQTNQKKFEFYWPVYKQGKQPNSLFQKSVISALEKVKYKPAQYKGKAVSSLSYIEFYLDKQGQLQHSTLY